MYSEVAKLCCDLIQLPSVNPGAQAEFSAPYGEEDIALYIAGWFQNYGIDVEMRSIGKRRMNVIASSQGLDSSRTVLLCSHMDTIDVDGMSVDPFRPKLTDGKIFGRGACDDKGPLAAMMIAFRDYVLQGSQACNAVFLATCGEESDLLGSRTFAAQRKESPDVIIVGEPTCMNISVAHKGIVRLTLKTYGKSAHSSTPCQGKNAIYLMREVLKCVEDYSRALTYKPPHGMLATETLAVTKIHGGESINSIPANCEIQIDWRILPNRKRNECIRELKDYLSARFSESVGMELICHFDPMETDPNHSEVKRIADTCRSVMGKCEITFQPYMTDASAWSNRNIPSVILGPGNPAQAHTSDEFISIDELEQAVDVYRSCLTQQTS